MWCSSSRRPRGWGRVQADSNANGRRAVNRYLYPPVSEGTAAEKAEEESEGIIVDDCNRRSGRPSQACGRLLGGRKPLRGTRPVLVL